MTAIIFLIVLAVLIFVHELGHFIAARIFGIRVDAFKIGFGPKLFSWKRGETEYGVNAIPFGGYVRIFGENPDATSESSPDAARSFVNKARWKQAIVLAAGVLFNFLFAWVLAAAIFSTGIIITKSIAVQLGIEYQDQHVVISYIAPGSPAQKAGLKPGDTITYVETTAMNAARVKNESAASSTPASLPGQSVAEIQGIVNDFGSKPVAFGFRRGSDMSIVGIIPVQGLIEGRYTVGIGMDEMVSVKQPFLSALSGGLRYTGVIIKETFVGAYGLIAGIFQGHPDFSEVTGPVGIFGIVGDAARMGFSYLLMITAIISVNLGVINLIPFPALDGGRILFVAIESAIRRRIPAKFSNIVNTVGFALLMALTLLLTWKDVAGLLHK